MIKSKTITFGFWLSLVMTIFCIGLVISLFIKEAAITKKIAVVGIIIIPLLIFASQIWRDGKFITIDTAARTICFMHFVTRKKTTYNFSDLQGFIDMYQPSKGGSYRVIYIVQEGKFVQKISTFIYSNVKEMEAALGIKYLGLLPFSYSRSINILLGKKVFES